LLRAKVCAVVVSTTRTEQREPAQDAWRDAVFEAVVDRAQVSSVFMLRQPRSTW